MGMEKKCGVFSQLFQAFLRGRRKNKMHRSCIPIHRCLTGQKILHTLFLVLLFSVTVYLEPLVFVSALDEPVEISYDDGTSETCGDYSIAGMLAIRFTPPYTPC